MYLYPADKKFQVFFPRRNNDDTLHGQRKVFGNLFVEKFIFVK